MRTLKHQTIYAKSQYKYTFYWAVWSQYCCIVKEDQYTSAEGWKVVRNLPLGRDLWRVIKRGAERIGPITPCDSIAEWNSDRIQWVKDQLAHS